MVSWIWAQPYEMRVFRAIGLLTLKKERKQEKKEDVYPT